MKYVLDWSIVVMAEIDTFTVNDNVDAYLQKERCNMILTVFIAIYSTICIDIMRISIIYQSPINNQSATYH